ncbi:L-aspartate oxidase [Pontibacter sp. KCTC 32443]|uniref:L-aspartate oxidase n=1 Tax=Pontibacter TaxID=323449 RepID=UPI00164E01CB|nr:MULTISPECIES: L-aspartate oxidase [Pontibacter]MBC5774717.1 L-aspartate oxidase [Pontibacter sp. KCTC 32443]
METLNYDFVVLGSGIAGLTFALEAAAHGKVLVLCKAAITETNTAYAQGGIAAVLSNIDSFEQHVQDTLTAGAGLCDETAVRFMVERAPESIKWLQLQSVQFDTAPDETIALGLEGGHCQHRIAHVKDHTGLSIQQALSKAAFQHPNITIAEYHLGIDLLTQSINQEKVCYGVQALDLVSGNYKAILAKAIVLATGGSGQVYQYTTNPTIATGDGLAMAYRAGATIRNMEFFQFHPTALYDPDSKDTFLISEALRGAGAELVLPDGTAFMQQYHPLGSLAPRDIVARAVYEQIHLHHSPCLYLDATRLPEGRLQKNFPFIYTKCKSIGIDAAVEFIPVVPAAHYQCGGIATDLHGQTSISGLYAVGEVACTGVHGANRLASNSLLEGVVFGKAAAVHVTSSSALHYFTSFKSLTYSLPGYDNAAELLRLKAELQAMVWEHTGIVRTRRGLEAARRKLSEIKLEAEQIRVFSLLYYELINLLTTAELIIEACHQRTESIGGHYIEVTSILPEHQVPELS